MKLLRKPRIRPRHRPAAHREFPRTAHEHVIRTQVIDVIALIHVSVPTLRVRIVPAPPAVGIRHARAAIRIILAPRARAHDEHRHRDARNEHHHARHA